MTKKLSLTYASADDLVLNAIINGLYSFKTKEDAQQILAGLREKFILSKLTPADSKDSLILWIKDFEITEEEKKKYAGNFASLFIEQKGKKFTLLAQKIPTDIKNHPQKVYEKSQHPNWGFPILRSVKKGKKFKTTEAASKELRILQEEFPKTAVPGAGKLYLMIYEKAIGKEKGGAVNKYVLEIKASPENDGFIIDYYLNTSVPKKAKPAEEQPAEAKEAQGKFTTMVELRRAKKKRTSPIRPITPKE